MDAKAAITADTMELLLLNQTAIRGALEELSLWVSHRGSIQQRNGGPDDTGHARGSSFDRSRALIILNQ